MKSVIDASRRFSRCEVLAGGGALLLLGSASPAAFAATVLVDNTIWPTSSVSRKAR